MLLFLAMEAVLHIQDFLYGWRPNGCDLNMLSMAGGWTMQKGGMKVMNKQ